MVGNTLYKKDIKTFIYDYLKIYVFLKPPLFILGESYIKQIKKSPMPLIKKQTYNQNIYNFSCCLYTQK
ncbi:hypothetical protein XSR1_610002 [Xenorhabdus szentirmaii DSM 16338]|uniref:Uncharacterized protein n=1 Tax=Xenorhabdus szentirmaii DSM 16338 TaxID=1427518 RepID=W1J6N4_9GAMM|nr:hypothetical protein XSR1_610002 [Xenorhabdus szentirmaii DSM 16338]